MNGSTVLGRVIVDELVRGGVADAVVAPGSRSAPLAMALYSAAAAGRLRLHVRIDERSAGYLALGLSKASGRPTAVVTTSGTATANLHPAVVEADASAVPLVVLTADRPPELRATGANQTIDQHHLYGSAVRAFHEFAPAGDPVAENAYWRAVVSRLLATARGDLTSDPGPVHLNVSFREPLVPDLDDPSAEPMPEQMRGRPGERPWSAIGRRVSTQPVDDPPMPMRTLVVVGDATPDVGTAAVRLAESRGWPLVSEPSGNARSGTNAVTTAAFVLAMPQAIDYLLPERVLVVGRPTVSRAVSALLNDRRVAVDVVATTPRYPDTARNVSVVRRTLPVDDGHHAADESWLRRWLDVERIARKELDGALNETGGETTTPSEPRLARDLHDALPADALLFAGSSMPIRDLFHTARARDGVTVMANRGASGIDGTVSSAIGAAIAWQRGGGGRAFALIGDLTFLHDANGLVLGPDEELPNLTLVVVNNDGGGIFGTLEQGAPENSRLYERIFGTPHHVELAAVCAATSTPFVRASSVAELVARAVEPSPGLRVIEIPTSRADVAGTYGRLRSHVERAIAAELS